MAYKRKKGVSIVKTKGRTYPYKGINYKSTLERNMAIALEGAGIEFEYEPTTYMIMDGFFFPLESYERTSTGKGDMVDRGQKKVLPIKYTPDFVGEDFIIETKGYANETFPRTWKMFKKYLTDNNAPSYLVLYKPQKISECNEVVKLIKQKRNERQTKEQ